MADLHLAAHVDGANVLTRKRAETDEEMWSSEWVR